MKRILWLLLFVCTGSFMQAQTLKPVNEKGAVSFVIKNFGINTKGTLEGLKGEIQWNKTNPANSSFTVTLDAATVNTGVEARDNHLRKEEYFHVEKYPVITFTSTAVSGTGPGFNMTGNLTLKGITKPVSFPFTVKEEGDGYLFEGNFTINRRDFGIGGNSLVMGDEVKVTLKVQGKP
jgi:polyisoprenoid-binding protein YceI